MSLKVSLHWTPTCLSAYPWFPFNVWLVIPDCLYDCMPRRLRARSALPLWLVVYGSWGSGEGGGGVPVEDGTLP